MKRPIASLLCIALAMMASASETGELSLAQYDQAYRQLRQAVWEYSATSRALGKDFRERTFADDLAASVLIPSTVEKLEALRVVAEQQQVQGSVQEAQKTLRRAMALVDEENGRGQGLFVYWERVEALTLHRRLWSRLADSAASNPASRPAAAQAAQSSRLRVAHEEAKLTTALVAPMTSEETQQHVTQTLAAYDAERVTMVAATAEEGVAMGRDRAIACPLPAAHSSGQATASFDLIPNPDDYYPHESRRLAVDGSVVIRARVDAAGCTRHIEVRYSSGVPELDAAALDFAEQARFFPAEKDGKPIEVQKEFKVTFRFRDS